jgi:hypothetical protein
MRFGPTSTPFLAGIARRHDSEGCVGLDLRFGSEADIECPSKASQSHAFALREGKIVNSNYGSHQYFRLLPLAQSQGLTAPRQHRRPLLGVKQT